MKISAHIGRVCALALVAAALAAPAAFADIDDVRGRPDGFQPQLQAPEARDQQAPLAGGRGVPDGYQPQLRGDQPSSVTSAEPREVPVQGVQGFDWADAGVGAAVAFGAMLLGADALLAGRSRRRVAHP